MCYVTPALCIELKNGACSRAIWEFSGHRFMVREMCGVQVKDRKRYIDLMFRLGLNETIDQLAMVDNVRWYGHVLRREDGHVLRRALYFEC